MQDKRQISTVTRQQIADEMQLANLWYHGRQSEPDFLGRLFDLKRLPSRDLRYSDAYEDIFQHMENNTDWDYNWFYSDPRINMLHCEDDLYLKFLSETIHPVVRTDIGEVAQLLEIYNKHLSTDGFEVFQSDEISGKPVFSGRQNIIGHRHLTAKKAELKNPPSKKVDLKELL